MKVASAVQHYHETMNEILSIQKASMEIMTNRIRHKISVHKQPIDEETAAHLQAYFAGKMIRQDAHEFTRVLVIESQTAKIYVPLKPETADEHGSN